MKTINKILWISLLWLFGLLSPQAQAAISTPPPAALKQDAPALAPPARRATPQPVYVGVHLNNVISLEVKLNVFWLNFYLWFRWKGDIDPTASFEMINAFEQWGQTVSPLTESFKQLPDGWKLKEYKIEQKFHNQFFFQDYPLDVQELPIKIEDREYTVDDLVYIPDGDITYNKDISVPGWEVSRQLVQVLNSDYKTKFGEVNNKEQTYSQFKYALQIQRPQLTHLFKLLLPVLIIIVIVGFIFLMPIIYYETRVSTAITALLSLIALQIVISDALPPVGYILLSDKIYYFSYLIILFTIIETVWVYYIDKDNPRLAKRLDKIGMGTIFLGTPIALLLMLSVVR